MSTTDAPARPRRGLGREFGALWLGSGVSNIGDGLRIAALPLLAVVLTDSPVAVAGITTAQFLPWILFAPFGGALVDRWRRRETILATQGWRSLVMIAVSLAVVTDTAAMWHLYLAGMLITTGEILVDPAVGALVPTVVKSEDLEAANSRIFGTEIVTNEFAGAPMGAAAFALAPWLPFLLDGMSYASSMLPFSRLKVRPHRVITTPTRVREDVREGFSWLRQHDFMGRFALVMGFANFGAIANFALLVLLVVNVLDASELAFGLVLTAGAAGAFLGTTVATRLSQRIGRRRMLVGALVAEGITMTAMAGAPNIWSLALLFFLTAIPSGLWMPVSRSLQQRITPNHLLGRVNASIRVITRGTMAIGSIVFGFVAAATSVRLAIAIGGLIDLSAGPLLWLVLRNHDLEPTPSAQDSGTSS